MVYECKMCNYSTHIAEEFTNHNNNPQHHRDIINQIIELRSKIQKDEQQILDDKQRHTALMDILRQFKN